MKDMVVAVLVAGLLLASTGCATLAAGKLGGASQLDRSAYSLSTDEQGGQDVAPLFTPGGKIGVQGGDDD